MLLYVDSQFASPYAMSAFVGLTEKGFSFEINTVDLEKDENRSGSYAKASLTQRVPTLVDSDFSLSESSAITEYLEDIRPNPPIYPVDPRHRARARQVQAWLRSDFLPIRAERSTEVVFYRPTAKPLSLAAQVASQKLFDACHELLSHGGDNLFGEWSIADVDMALMLNRLVLNGDKTPSALARYAAMQWQRPSVQLWVQKTRPMLKS